MIYSGKEKPFLPYRISTVLVCYYVFCMQNNEFFSFSYKQSITHLTTPQVPEAVCSRPRRMITPSQTKISRVVSLADNQIIRAEDYPVKIITQIADPYSEIHRAEVYSEIAVIIRPHSVNLPEVVCLVVEAPNKIRQCKIHLQAINNNQVDYLVTIIPGRVPGYLDNPQIRADYLAEIVINRSNKHRVVCFLETKIKQVVEGYSEAHLKPKINQVEEDYFRQIATVEEGCFPKIKRRRVVDCFQIKLRFVITFFISITNI